MNLSSQIARHLRELYFGGNWTWSNFKDNLAGVTWQQATVKVQGLNTIAALVFHADYFVCAALRVLKNEPINAHDKYSFDHPAIQSAEDWQALLNNTWSNIESLALLVEQLPENKLWETFQEEKYGNYYRNLHGIIEHSHYHLGQIALIKKLISINNESLI